MLPSGLPGQSDTTALRNLHDTVKPAPSTEFKGCLAEMHVIGRSIINACMQIFQEVCKGSARSPVLPIVGKGALDDRIGEEQEV
jgi:hypothetical protein